MPIDVDAVLGHKGDGPRTVVIAVGRAIGGRGRRFPDCPARGRREGLDKLLVAETVEEDHGPLAHGDPGESTARLALP